MRIPIGVWLGTITFENKIKMAVTFITAFIIILTVAISVIMFYSVLHVLEKNSPENEFLKDKVYWMQMRDRYYKKVPHENSCPSKIFISIRAFFFLDTNTLLG